MDTKQTVLQECRVANNNIYLPDKQLDRKLYQQVASALEMIGGKWKGGKVMGFEFPSDPTELLIQIANGESRNLKKEFQFFATPDDLADILVQAADIQANHNVLEPSAGQGAIIKAIRRTNIICNIDCYELMPLNGTFLEKITDINLVVDDFLAMMRTDCYDRIVANPPFSKNQDIDHIRHMYKFLKPGGRLVSVSSKHWTYSTASKEKMFAEWLVDLEATVIEIPAGSFKESGTNIPTVMIVIDKK